MNNLDLQRRKCEQYQSAFSPVADWEKCGLAIKTLDGRMPINGLRHPREESTCGWYFWAGEKLSQHAGFFEPLHVKHLSEYCPVVLPFLALEPGFRFLLAAEYEDVWFDEKLLKI